MELGLLIVLVLLGAAIQVALMALAVHWGTYSIRRELFEMRLQAANLGLDGDDDNQPA